MHGVREELLRMQAEKLGIPLKTVYLPENASMEAYDRIMGDHLEALRTEGYTTAVFGDIFLDDLREYRERRLAILELKALFPLWGENTLQLARHFIDTGFKAVVCCVNGAVLDKSFAGRSFDHAFLQDLPPGVDPSGEHGEFHSFVYDGPIFGEPVTFDLGEVVERSYGTGTDKGVWDTRFFFCDLLPRDQ